MSSIGSGTVVPTLRRHDRNGHHYAKAELCQQRVQDVGQRWQRLEHDLRSQRALDHPGRQHDPAELDNLFAGFFKDDPHRQANHQDARHDAEDEVPGLKYGVDGDRRVGGDGALQAGDDGAGRDRGESAESNENGVTM